AEANRRLAEACTTSDGVKLVPFGSINPQLPDWQEDLRRCSEMHRMPGIRLHPNYHGYTLDAPVVAELLDEAYRRALIVQIALSMEDERTQSPLARVPHVDPLPLRTHLKRLPKLRVQLINAFRAVRADKASTYADFGNVTFDIAMLEGIARLPKLIAEVTPDRVLFGSYFPFFYHEAAMLKVKEGALAHETLAMVTHRNARRLLELT
ncbi:MAG TPA: amidohydrolase family protein, partial [Pirellulales bacterium]|nr:amidohydrolase family protein [Pirellulales bacterium]